MHLPNTYVIFFTESDIFKEDKPIYQIERINVTTGKMFNDGEHIIYVNGAYDNKEDESDLAKLIHDFRCSKADDMILKPLADKTRYLKETPEGVEYMCKAMEERINEKTIKIALNLISMGFKYEDISKATELTLEKVKELAEKAKPANA